MVLIAPALIESVRCGERLVDLRVTLDVIKGSPPWNPDDPSWSDYDFGAGTPPVTQAKKQREVHQVGVASDGLADPSSTESSNSQTASAMTFGGGRRPTEHGRDAATVAVDERDHQGCAAGREPRARADLAAPPLFVFRRPRSASRIEKRSRRRRRLSRSDLRGHSVYAQTGGFGDGVLRN